MANEQNLRTLSPEEAREQGRKGGKASAAARAARKTFREGLLILLAEELKDKVTGQPTGKTTQDAVIAGLVKRAISGDVRAAEFIRDTIGEKPVQDVAIMTGDFSALDEAFRELGKT